jgi:hypothetical protein
MIYHMDSVHFLLGSDNIKVSDVSVNNTATIFRALFPVKSVLHPL